MSAEIKKDWSQNPRWKGIKRGYSAEDVARLRGSVQIEHTLAKRGAEKLWQLCTERAYVHSLGALTGNQAVQQVRAGVPAIYLSGWQVAADAIDWLAPIVADAESGFGGVLNAFELMKSMIDAGAAGVHYEDQLASVKKCGH